ncbi:MAG: amidohydrolase family protein [Bacteroidota bacterium]|nr:amidohydrolase family protein [Bacteroidota bacterium]
MVSKNLFSHYKKYLSFVLVLFFGFSCTDSTKKTVYYNASGYTIESDSLLSFSTLVVDGQKVFAVGGDDLASKYLNMPSVTVFDLEGKTLLPGIIDAHGHVMGLGFQELQINLAGITSLQGTLQVLKEYAEANPELEWIIGRGWNQTLWEENRFPTAADLDQVIPDRPVWLSRVDGHAGWANTKAIQLAQVSSDTPDPIGGKIIRDTRGRPTGVFIDAAEGYVQTVVPESTREEQTLALNAALSLLSSYGVTSVHDAGVGVETWELYKEFAIKRKLRTRIYGMISGAGMVFDQLSSEGPIQSLYDDRLALRSVKLYSDGALGSRGAALIEDYHDDPGNKGLLFIDQEEMNLMVEKVVSKGYQANIHAIGDAANRQVLDALGYAQQLYPREDQRNRIEHAQIVALEDIVRFKDLDIIASMQPTHATSDKNMAEDRVGPQRIKGAYAWQSFLRQGTVVASGSDFPVESANPFLGFHASITRKDIQGNPLSGWYSNEAMDRVQTLKSFTIDAAFAGFQEDVLGSLEPGKWADFIIIDQDIMMAPDSMLWQTKVLQTWVAGEKVFDLSSE